MKADNFMNNEGWPQEAGVELRGNAGVLSKLSVSKSGKDDKQESEEGLLEEILKLKNLNLAYKRVKGNGGSHGVDGMRVEELLVYLKQHGKEIWRSILEGRYKPQAVRWGEIPKSDGGVRQLEKMKKKTILRIIISSLTFTVFATIPVFAQNEVSHPTIVAQVSDRAPLKGKLREWIQKRKDARQSIQKPDSEPSQKSDSESDAEAESNSEAIDPLTSSRQQWGATSIDCTAHNPRCPALVILGDVPQKSKFHGFADPSMRRDPNTGTLWLAYSWPHTLKAQRRAFSRFSRPNIAVDIHLAQSDDNGKRWRYTGPLWQAHPLKNPVTGAENFSSHEVANLWPQNQNGKTVWYAIHLYYLVKPNSFIYSQLGGYSYFSLSMASSPTELANAPSQILGFGGTVKGLGPDVNLASLSPDLDHCTIWNEPALTMQGNTLYLAAQCMYASGSKLVPEKNFYAIFSTQPQGDIKTWQWQYQGKLAGPTEAAELENHQFWVQLDFAKKADGTLLAILTPSEVGNTEHDKHYGCRVLQIVSLDSPALARDASGKLIVLASVTASDLMTSVGPAACTYEPSATTGIVMTRRLAKDLLQGYYWTLHKTGLKP